ncbi:dTDP-4-dehydrorhamnose reductase [Pectobacterium sp. F1-1]|uniref:dTDP-4-dehydrorhamnose reductase n=1 Tax=Pectobacterium sp. F1-1 TaxID=2949614 RepID=UPI0021D79163|nr:dTDP-4-dehydrorhamnose reductase [Pectobacterium sp. F1-1]UYA59605.1 dTDP-4-dehydrorhamnose reductase [Pectobacterium sp. F1-1]
MRILLTGANGQLGRCLQDRVPKEWELWATDSSVLDITDADAVSQAVSSYKPDVVVNAAAYTAVDKAESEPELATLINVFGPKNLAWESQKVGARFIHVSTDYVFDGKSNKPYVETDITCPLGVYGKTKRDGELAVLNTGADAIIIRTAWVFSEYGNNFVKTMLRLGRSKESLAIVSDQRGCPTYAGDIADAIIDLLIKKAEPGIYHYCGDKEVSWFEFAEEIFSAASEFESSYKIPKINAILSEQYPTPAARPMYSSLNCDKINAYDIFESCWNIQLSNIIKKIL